MNNGIKTTNKEFIPEVPWGMVVWQTQSGEFIAQDGNFMHVFIADVRNKEVLRAAVKALRDAARDFGEEDGKPVFWGGRRPIDDEQLAEQLRRAEKGLIPDPLDIGAINDEMKAIKQNGSY